MRKLLTIFVLSGILLSLVTLDVSAAGRAYLLTNRTTSGDSSRWDIDAVLSATNRAFTDPLNEYAVENGFNLVCYERVTSQQIDDAPVYYQFTAPDNKNHYIVTLSYNVNITFQEGNQSGVTTYLPTTTDDVPYVYSYSVTQKMSTYTTLKATFAVYEYRSSEAYNTQMMILDYNVPMDDDYVVAFPSAAYSFYFPIYAPQIVEDMDTAISIIDGVAAAIDKQTDEILNYDVSVFPSDDQVQLDSKLDNMDDLEAGIYDSIEQVQINDGGMIQDLLSDDYTGAFGVFRSLVDNLAYGPVYTMIFFTLLLGCALFILGKVVR